MSAASDRVALVRAFLDSVWNAGDLSDLDRFLAPAYTIRDDPGDPWEGQTLDHDAFRTRVAYSRDAFPDLRFDVQEAVDGGDRVVVRWRMSGTHRGDLPGLPATGRSVSVSGLTIYDLADGRIAGHAQAFDRLGLLAQLGRLEAMAGPPPEASPP